MVVIVVVIVVVGVVGVVDEGAVVGLLECRVLAEELILHPVVL